jgi:succinoglycan biosynthesis protein ExoW
MTLVCVIIPVFQRRPEAFRSALDSVLRQRLSPDCRLDVIVVDDESPCPPQIDGDCPPSANVSVRVIRRPNGGPAAARNTGLDAVPDEADYIAFLDSDDAWAQDHLERALCALGTWADFYFSDQENSQLTRQSTHFDALRAQLRDSANADVSAPEFLTTPRDSSPQDCERAYLLPRSDGLAALLRWFLPHLSVTVIRARRLGQIRFCEDLKSSGEDYLYFLMLADGARMLSCSTRVGVHRGRGVNIFHDSLSWDNPKSFGVVLDALRSFLIARSRLHLDPPQKKLLERRIAFRRLELVARCLADIRRRRPPALRLAFRADPAIAYLFPYLSALAVWRKALGKPIPDYLRAIESP